MLESAFFMRPIFAGLTALIGKYPQLTLLNRCQNFGIAKLKLLKWLYFK